MEPEGLDEIAYRDWTARRMEQLAHEFSVVARATGEIPEGWRFEYSADTNE